MDSEMGERIESVEIRQTEEARPAGARLLRWRPFIEAGLLLLASCLMFYSAVFNGRSYDEIAHINTGLAFWTQGKPNLDLLHPPLRVMFGLPAWWLLAPPPGDFLTPFPPQSASAILLGARLIMVAVFLAWSWLFGRLAGRWMGAPAGLAALALILFEPTMAAHASLATTDILFMTTAFLSAAAAFEWVRRPGWGRALMLGVALGLTMLAKYQSILWFVGLAMGAAVYLVMKGRPFFRGRWSSVAMQLGVALLVAWALFCTPYQFRGVGTPFGRMPLTRSDFGRKVMRLGSIPSPIPEAVLTGIDELMALQGGRASYFHGQLRPGGAFFWYFPALLLLKPPLALWGLVLLSLASWIRLKGWRWAGFWFFAIPVAFFFVMIAFVFDLQIGVRHISPVFPFLAIAAAWATVSLPGQLWRGAAWALVACVVIVGVSVTPNQLGYFNQLAGGPAGGWHWFADSNQDWGQGGPAIGRYMAKTGKVFNFDPVEGKTTGWVCITTNGLVGLNPEQREKMRWLREGFKVRKFVEPSWVIFKIPKDYWKKQHAKTPEPATPPESTEPAP